MDKKKFNFKRYLIYLGRWQLSTPILTLVMILLSGLPYIWGVIIANLIGGAIFYFVDKKIFKPKRNE